MVSKIKGSLVYKFVLVLCFGLATQYTRIIQLLAASVELSTFSSFFSCFLLRLLFQNNFDLQTLDQLFQLRLPMDITHLQALLSIIFHTLDAYLQKVTSELGM